MAYNFDKIASTYDRLNHLMTLGLDRCWRRRAVRELSTFNFQLSVLDVACGTGDMAVELVRHGCDVTGIDISEEMLAIAKQKAENAKWIVADAENLPFDDNAFDAVTCAFGVRNFTDLERGLGEMARVLKPGGRLVILELSYPENPALLALYKLYATKIIPILGKIISGNREAYEYLPSSILAFPKPERFALILNNIGLKTAKVRRITFGVCTEYLAVKP
ncbi:MAG: bifunctional demethylmenaquinone methyltransferase/2-methoxy-6-polyprenyl-1,4-benzoquinol methylase UbiE [Bacteroidales bacterium]|nr:bifunctional demethylmenaquinone methyltransferase/2-methoxy-6-polyprenyl-1,4-benzoquinol methylase UbiE [Bacteroidales bacterium]